MKSFRIRHSSPDTGGKWATLTLDELTAANELFLDGVVDFDLTKDKLKLVLANQYAIRDRDKRKPAFMKSNLALVKALWEDKYPPRVRRSLKAPEESRRDYDLAAEACGLFPIDTCDLDELANHLDKTLGSNPTRHARRVVFVNSVLDWLKRPRIDSIRIRARPQVKHLTEAEYLKVRKHVTNPDNLLLMDIAFYTGMRLGEIFHIQPQNVRIGSIYIERQMLDKRVKEKDPKSPYRTDTTKDGNPRTVLMLDVIKDKVIEWAKRPLAEKEAIRGRSFSKVVHKACLAAKFKDPLKNCCFHDLRHCNAIWLLSKGASLHEVAQHLGDLVTTTERFYSGFVLKQDSIDRLKQAIDGPKLK